MLSDAIITEIIRLLNVIRPKGNLTIVIYDAQVNGGLEVVGPVSVGGSLSVAGGAHYSGTFRAGGSARFDDVISLYCFEKTLPIEFRDVTKTKKGLKIHYTEDLLTNRIEVESKTTQEFEFSTSLPVRFGAIAKFDNDIQMLTNKPLYLNPTGTAGICHYSEGTYIWGAAGTEPYSLHFQGVAQAPAYFEMPVKIDGGITTPITTKTASYTATAADSTILGDATIGAITISLPTAVGIAGRKYTVKKIDSSANAVILDPAGTETIDGVATLSLTTQWGRATVQSDGANWQRID